MLGIYVYSAAFLAQLLAAIYAVNLYLKTQSYRVACGFLALGFALMLGRRISPIYELLQGREMNAFDAWLSLAISCFLLIGVFHVKQVWEELEKKNFLLGQSLKTDNLTGALSRPETFYLAQLEIERSLRSKTPLAFLMLDIDRFKDVNDRFGHPLGDAVLKNLANICLEQLRAIDIFGRVGGEEFLAVLPDANEHRAYEIADRLREYIALTSCGTFGPPIAADNPKNEIHITVSIGIAIFDPLRDGETLSAVILKKYYDLCDKAMYRAKQSGRNRVSI